MAEWWESAPLAQSDPSFTGFIPGMPTPVKPSAPPSEFSQQSTNIDNAANLRKEFNSLPEAKNYSEAMSALTGAFKAPDNAQGDLGVIYSFAKVMDPGSVVREGEMDMANSTSSLIQGLYRKYGQIAEGNRLPPEVRLQLMETARAKARALNEAYSQRREQYSDIASKIGADPSVIVGNHIGDAFRPTEEAWVKGANLVQGPRTVDTGDNVEGRRLSAEQQAEYVSFLQSKPDAAALNDWWSKRGFPGLANAEEVAAAVREGKPVDTGVDYSKVDSAAEAAARARRAEEDKSYTPANEEVLARSGATFAFSDELRGIGGALANPLSPVKGYQTSRDAERLRIADAREQLGWKGTAIELGSGLLTAPIGGTARATSALGTIAQGAKMGAYGGALAGFGAGEGFEGSLGSAAIGGTLGAGLGAGVSGISTRLGPKGMNPELARAADVEGVDLIRPMVDPKSISDFGALESNIYSQPIIRSASAKTREQIGGRVDALGKDGEVLEAGAAGERLQVAGNRYITRSRGIANRLYDRASKLSGGAAVTPAKAVAQIDQELADLQSLPNVNDAEIRFMQELKDDLSRGPLSVDAIRSLRTSLRGRIGTSNLTMTQAEARAARVMEAATEDVTAAVPPEAAAAYRRADAFYRERQVMVDDIKQAILGKKYDQLDPQKAFSNLKSLTGPSGNGRRLGAIMRHLEPDERQDIAATVAQSLGRDSPDEPFSAAKFLTRTSNSKLSPSARRTIFGPDGAESIDNLRLLSRKLVEAGADINRSRSATVLERQGFRTAARAVISGIAGIGGTTVGGVGGGVAGLAVAGAAMGAGAARRVLSARAMVNPRVSRWLAESADVSTPAQAQTAVRRLGNIIAREPALSGELGQLQQFLSNALRPAAASDEVEPEQ